MTVTVARVPKSAREEVRVSLREMDGVRLVEMRVWEVRDGQAARTGKFVLLPARHAPDLAEAIMKAVRFAMVGDALRP
ncbi:hypothetical protein FF100_33510 [Methylobacterium terricola]|uniref:Transcriptional coactivator p15 (PC4) C-terminal domain-containing protein n=1 Tax=Methylobacterium terricola TaxID=2583531 RepID=A0A5C4L6T9_9HYPH|nr:hypothetical protein [Methylobacterium terricola]TNC07095.1 hypothetical protein FF100_33510 [Methylobacterium terricola]